MTPYEAADKTPAYTEDLASLVERANAARESALAEHGRVLEAKQAELLAEAVEAAREEAIEETTARLAQEESDRDAKFAAAVEEAAENKTAGYKAAAADAVAELARAKKEHADALSAAQLDAGERIDKQQEATFAGAAAPMLPGGRPHWPPESPASSASRLASL